MSVITSIKCDACSAIHNIQSEEYFTIEYKDTNIHICLDCTPNIDKEFIIEQVPKPLYQESFYKTVHKSYKPL
jgi:hypothetical protein